MGVPVFHNRSKVIGGMKLPIQSPYLTDEETEAQKEGIDGPWSQGEFRGQTQILTIPGQFFFCPIFLALQTEARMETRAQRLDLFTS